MVDWLTRLSIDLDSNVCSTTVMESGRSGHQYEAGYRDGRSAAVSVGSSSPARDWIEAHPHLGEAYIAGFEWALWDFDDANGIRAVPSSASERRATSAG